MIVAPTKLVVLDHGMNQLAPSRSGDVDWGEVCVQAKQDEE